MTMTYRRAHNVGFVRDFHHFRVPLFDIKVQLLTINAGHPHAQGRENRRIKKGAKMTMCVDFGVGGDMPVHN